MQLFGIESVCYQAHSQDSRLSSSLPESSSDFRAQARVLPFHEDIEWLFPEVFGLASIHHEGSTD
jgi:hypothetical protein